jgi:hypothetical protein
VFFAVCIICLLIYIILDPFLQSNTPKTTGFVANTEQDQNRLLIKLANSDELCRHAAEVVVRHMPTDSKNYKPIAAEKLASARVLWNHKTKTCTELKAVEIQSTPLCGENSCIVHMCRDMYIYSLQPNRFSGRRRYRNLTYQRRPSFLCTTR